MAYQWIDHRHVNITGGFWHRRQRINTQVTAPQVYDRFAETYRFEALACRWQEGDPYKPHVYWDSDVAKWIEGVAYILDREEQPELRQLARAAIGDILKNQTEEGYFNSHFLVMEQDERFKNRNLHELYCAGHLMEAACAWYHATGERDFLEAMCRYADYIYEVFCVKQSAPYATSGHPEIELALVRLYEATGQVRYREMALWFLQERGNNPKDRPVADWTNEYYAQDQLPLEQQRTVEGHCVRAMYLYCAMADAVRLGEGRYAEACDALFDDVLEHKLYITGGIGSNKLGESFATPYYLPNDEAYTETCAAISLAMYAQRMLRLKPDGCYGDVIERILYNGMLSGVGLEGKTFFYTNPLEIDPMFFRVNTSTVQKRYRPVMQRPEVFSCSCCPPNVVRFVAALGDYLYTYDADTLYVHQFMESETVADGITATQKTRYPENGAVTVSVTGKKRIAIRIPGWCPGFTASAGYTLENGYAYFDAQTVTVEFQMPVTLVEANTLVQNNAGRVAVTRGPVVYCLEEADNGRQLRSVRLDARAAFAVEQESEFGLPVLTVTGEQKKSCAGLYGVYSASYEKKDLRFIPYFAFANRGISEMLVWIAVK